MSNIFKCATCSLTGTKCANCRADWQCLSLPSLVFPSVYKTLSSWDIGVAWCAFQLLRENTMTKETFSRNCLFGITVQEE